MRFSNNSTVKSPHYTVLQISGSWNIQTSSIGNKPKHLKEPHPVTARNYLGEIGMLSYVPQDNLPL